MKTASLGLLEVMVVRVNAGGMPPPPGPPLCGDVTGPSPFLCFLKKRFLANERDNIFGEESFLTQRPKAHTVCLSQ